jgi:hypothetical protein
MANKRLFECESSSQTKIQCGGNFPQHKKGRGRPKKPLNRKRDVRVSFRVSFREYKALLERCGGKRRLSGFIRKALGVE